MNIEQKKIEGIYNFCDSWCERCMFTLRCQSYQIQVENGLNKPIDPNLTMMQQLTEALTLTRQYLDKISPNNAPNGLLPAKQPVLEKQILPDLASRHPIAQLAHAYLHHTGDWLRTEKNLLEQAGFQQLHEVKLGLRTEAEALAQLNPLKDAWEMIKWYRTLIAVKTVSALRIFNEVADNVKLTDYYLGKAKLVLVSIDQSLLAWQTVMNHFPEKTDELLSILALLNRINREIELLFPNARAFRRPGFD